MHCDQCGKENRSGSKFCRSCGSNLSESSQRSGAKHSSKLSWKSPIVLIVIILILLGGLVYGGSKAYAYYQVESKINSAKKLQTIGNYKESIDTLIGWENKTLTNSQKTRIENIKADGQKFVSFKASFDNAVAIQNATSTATTTLSVSLKNALNELQSIDSNYPEYKNVQTEIKKVQDALVIALENEANTSKKAAADAVAQAEKNRAAAAAAQAARDRAEQNAQQAASNAQAQANAARSVEVARSFRNELTTGYNSYLQASKLYSSAIQYSNANNHLLAIAQANSASSVLTSAYTAVNDLSDRYTGLPSSYYSASNNMLLAIGYLSKALDLLVDSEGTSLDYSSSINSNKNSAVYYAGQVSSFLTANYQ